MTTQLREMDVRMLRWLQGRDRPGLTRAMKTVTHLGDWPAWTLAGLLMGASGPLGLSGAVHMAIAAAVGIATSQLLKRRLKRPRPDATILGFIPRAANPDPWSFPSGHTTTAFAIATAVGGLDLGFAAVLLPFATAVGFSRVYLGAHYPLDVLAGAGLGIACGGAVLALPL